MQALETAGMLQLGVRGLEQLAHTSSIVAHLATAFSVGLLSNGMNNLPVGLIGGAAVHASHVTAGIAHAVLIGVDLGPNLSVTGSLATILWLIALRREHVKISALEFLKVGNGRHASGVVGERSFAQIETADRTTGHLHGAGPFMGFTVTAALITSVAIDHFGWFHMPMHPANPGRIVGGLLMVCGIALIARF
jgi:hypothetical protein